MLVRLSSVGVAAEHVGPALRCASLQMGYLKKDSDGSLLYSVVNTAEPDADGAWPRAGLGLVSAVPGSFGFVARLRSRLPVQSRPQPHSVDESHPVLLPCPPPPVYDTQPAYDTWTGAVIQRGQGCCSDLFCPRV